jgi:hypothetical protein
MEIVLSGEIGMEGDVSFVVMGMISIWKSIKMSMSTCIPWCDMHL